MLAGELKPVVERIIITDLNNLSEILLVKSLPYHRDELVNFRERFHFIFRKLMLLIILRLGFGLKLGLDSI